MIIKSILRNVLRVTVQLGKTLKEGDRMQRRNATIETITYSGSGKKVGKGLFIFSQARGISVVPGLPRVKYNS